MRLSHKDFDALQKATLELHEYRELDTFRQALPSVLLKLIPADYFFVFECELSPKLDGVKVVSMVDPSRQLTSYMIRLMEQGMFEHPFPKHFAQTGDRSALKLTDFLTLPQFERMEIYQVFHRSLGIDRQLAAPADFGPGRIGAVNFGGTGKDFTERDRTMVNLLRPHLELARRNAESATRQRTNGLLPVAAYELTPRETEIAQWVAAGKSNPEIAIILQIASRTVEKHMEKILEKLGVENRTTAAVMIANGNGHANGPANEH